jgi:hypothetical protein
MTVRSDALVVAAFSGTDVVDIGTVPAGERWLVKEQLAYNQRPNAGTLYVAAAVPGHGTVLITKLALGADDLEISERGTVLLEGTDLTAVLTAAGDGDCTLLLSGVRFLLG